MECCEKIGDKYLYSKLELILSGNQWGLISNKYNKGIKTPEKPGFLHISRAKKLGRSPNQNGARPIDVSTVEVGPLSAEKRHRVTDRSITEPKRIALKEDVKPLTSDPSMLGFRAPPSVKIIETLEHRKTCPHETS